MNRHHFTPAARRHADRPVGAEAPVTPHLAFEDAVLIGAAIAIAFVAGCLLGALPPTGCTL